MKKITFLFCLLLSSFSAIAQFTFPTQGPETVSQDTPVTLNLNDVANTAGVTAGLYSSFTVSVDWTDGSGGNVIDSDNNIEITTPTANSGERLPQNANFASTPITLTYEGIFPSPNFYDPSVDGTLNLTLNVTFGGADTTTWSNIIVTLNPKPACVTPIPFGATNISSTSTEVSWTAGDIETLWDIEIVDVSGGGSQTFTPTQTGLSSTTFLATGLTTGNFHQFYVRANCGGTDGVSEWSNAFGFSPVAPCNSPNNLTLSNITATSVDASWDQEPTSNDGYIAEIYNQGAFPGFDVAIETIFIMDPTTTTAMFTGLTGGNTYDVYVITNCDDANFIRSSHAFPETFTATTLSVDAFDKNSIKLYPNPTRSKLQVKSNYNLENITVFNLLGKEKLNLKIVGRNAEIDLSTLSVGNYFVKVTTDNGVDTYRVIKN